jgi:hypothetical protein
MELMFMVERREKLFLERMEHRPHMAHRAVAEEGHGPMGDAPFRLDLRPPHTAMAKADAVLVERFGDDDVVDARPREQALFRQIGDASETAGFLVHGARYLDRAVEIERCRQKRLGCDDGGGKPAFHVACAAPVDPAVPDRAAERVHRPPFAGLDHVDMRVEVDDRPWAATLDARDDIRARIAVGIAGRSFAADEADREAAPPEPFAHEFGAGRIGFARRVDGRETDEVGGELNEVFDPFVNRFCQFVDHDGRDAANAAAWQGPRCRLCAIEETGSVPVFQPVEQ